MLETYGQIADDEAVRKLADVITGYKIELLNNESQIEFMNYQRVIIDNF